jgi:hydrogenase nickel incorporation protein HypA/HybF
MHELSLAYSAIELIEKAARRESFGRVRVLRMEIGRLSCVEPEALRFAFESAAAGTCAEGAQLEIDRVEGSGACPACGAAVAMEQVYDLCPACGAHPLRVVRGLEMRVKHLDVE